MNFLIMLVLKYVLLTAMLFLMGMFMHCLFDGECLEYRILPKQNELGEKLLTDRNQDSVIETCYGQNIIDNIWQKGNIGEENKQK